MAKTKKGTFGTLIWLFTKSNGIIIKETMSLGEDSLLKKLRWAFFITSFAAVLLIFQNCGNKFAAKTDRVPGLGSVCKAQKSKLSPFQIQKLQLDNQNHSTHLQKMGTPQTLELALVVDSQCVRAKSQPLEFLGQTFEINSIVPNQKRVAVDLNFPILPDESVLSQALDSNSCFIGLTENKPVKTGQTTVSESVNDPQASQQGHLQFMGYPDSLVLQRQITSSVVVAVIDTGVDYNHFDLRNRMWQSPQGERGFNFINNSNNPMDDDGHGTHVAGIIAAEENNAVGGTGLTLAFTRIMAVKALGADGVGTSQDVYNGIMYAINNGADIINLSVEAPGQNTLLEDALNQAVNAGVVVIASTGNQGEEILPTNLFAPAYIAPQFEGVISVASIDSQDARLSFYSNYSSFYTEFSAPGAEISANFQRGILSTDLNNRYTRIMGTSQSSPMVTSAAAILIGYLKTQGLSYTPAGVESFLKSDGSGLSPQLEPYIVGGRVAHIGFLSSNLIQYFESLNNGDMTFDGDNSTGNQCVIN